MDFVCGGLAASCAAIFSNPLDVLKTRMQLQGELRTKGTHTVYYKNVFHAGCVVFQNEGIRGLQKGLLAAVPLHGIRNSFRLGLYEWFNRNGYIKDKNGQTVFVKSAVVSAFSGAVGALVGSPLFLVKTQLQSQAAANIAVGHQHHHKGIAQAFIFIYKEHGIFGLWRGANAIVLRALLGSSAQLSTFALSKDKLRQIELLNKSPIAVSIISSLISGFFQTAFMQPMDLVSTRLYNQGVDAQGRGLLYNGVTDAFIKIGKKEGIRGFYKGVTANYMRLGPHGTLTLVFWDILKSIQTNEKVA